MPRFFRPTFLEVYGLSNADLGDAFAAYGVVAMLAYFPGGLIADRFSARRLVTVSLLATSLGGLYLLRGPSATGLSLLFAYWGITTILLFWAAIIRATREWGGHGQQGSAFGFLDGGRGLFAAGAASLAVWLFARVVGDEAKVFLVDVNKVIMGQAPEKNFPLQDGDVVFVPGRKRVDWRQLVSQLFQTVAWIRIIQD